MCGIAGIFHAGGCDVDAARLKRMSDSIKHRGPDNTSIQISGPIGMAHNRLSLLDLGPNGNQPFMNHRYILVYNGEIYNFKKLRNELEQERSIAFISSSDTEVLFYLLIHYGIKEALKKIEGMFAFGFYDKEEQVLFLARDRLGIKPLFYYCGSDEISFASELKALTSVLDLKQDRRRIVQSVFGYIEHSRSHSPFQNLYQVEPGRWMEFHGDGKIKDGIYFRLPDLVEPEYYNELNKIGHDAVVERFEGLFEDSVNKMLVADAPIGAFVSGGIDSSLISTVAKQLGSNPLLYSVNVMGRYSEIEAARHLSETLETTINEFEFHPEMFVRDWVHTTWHNDAPVVVNLHAVPFGNITRLAHQKRDKAVLTGEGADELFFGYPRHVRERFEKLLMAPQAVLDAIYRRIPGVGIMRGRQREQYLKELRLMENQYEDVENEKHYDEAVAFIESDYIRRMQRLSLKLVDKTLYSLLWRNDRMGMMNSIESRFPFLDEEILRFACSLPLKYKIRRTLDVSDIRHPFMTDKYIIRRLASKTLPSVLAKRKKQAFPIHGHHDIRIDKEYFIGGFWQEFMRLSDSQVRYMCDTTQSFLLAKIASVDIWGRLFCWRQSKDDVQSRVIAYCHMNV